MSAPKPPTGFVSLKSITQGPSDPRAALAELRHIYFNTTKRTIEHDFDHAIELLKSLPTEEEREKATVYMEGIAEMRKEWAAGEKRPEGGRRGERGKAEGETGNGTNGGFEVQEFRVQEAQEVLATFVPLSPFPLSPSPLPP